MLVYAIAFLFGNVLFQQMPVLPGITWLAITPLIAGILTQHKAAQFMGVLTLSFCWVWCAAFIRLDGIQNFDGGEFEVDLRIASIPINRGIYTRFTAIVVSQTPATDENQLTPDKLRLGLYGEDPELQLGETIHARVRLKPLHGYSNPYTFDYERSLFAQGIGATGYIRNWSRVPGTSANIMQRFRQSIYDELLSHLRTTDNAGAVLALTLGERGYMTRQQWQLLMASGVGHLFAISGLHIALLFLLIYQCVFYLWRRFFIHRYYLATPLVASFVAFPFAFIYAWLAGFSLPTQRALIMLGCVLFAQLMMRKSSLANSLALALLIILCLDPFSTLSASFWFSFLAIAGIIIFISATRTSGWFVRWVGLHLYLPIILLSVSLWFFHRGALFASIANVFAIPYASFLVLPCVLLAALFSVINETIAAGLVWVADLLLDGFWYAAALVENMPMSQWLHKPLWWSHLSATIGAILIVMTRNLRYQTIGVLFMLTLLLEPPPSIAEGAFESTFLDVGQGLAVVVKTRTHTLLFDTGPKYPSGFDLGAAVVLPFLVGNNITHLDALVLSHGDNDHIGGADAVLAQLDVTEKYIGGNNKQTHDISHFSHCRNGLHWVWDKVHFTFLNPSQLSVHSQSENNASCVLKIYNDKYQLLLTGDIEKSAEYELLRNSSTQLNASVISVPHHGSNTSSNVEFLQAVKPQIAIVSSGFRNRFNFPNATVLQRYQNECIAVYNTAETGAVRLYFPTTSLHKSPRDFKHNKDIQITLHRIAAKHYWQTSYSTQQNNLNCTK